MSSSIHSAIVLSAGLGMRMRPLTDTIPKPLVRLAGRCLIDHVLSRIEGAGIERAVINVHYLADLIEAHLSNRDAPKILFSDERNVLLDTGGGVKKALSLLEDQPFIVHNSDSVWIEEATNNLSNLMSKWDPDDMDCLLLLAPVSDSLGYNGKGDFLLHEDGLLSRRKEGQDAPFVFAGVSVMKPQLFEDTPNAPFSLNLVWNKSIERKRLFGLKLDGQWMHIGTPQALQAAELWIANAAHA